MDITKVKDLIKASEELKDKAKILNEESAAKKQEARVLCTHEVTEVKEDYHEGSYLDQAYTTIKTYCGICGLLLKTDSETHTWYG